MSFGIDASSLLSSQSSNSTTGGSGGLRQFADLGLSEEQRTKMRSILQNAKSQGTSQADVQQQLEQVLTPDQRAQFNASQTAQTSQTNQPAKTELAANVQNARAAGSGHHRHHGGGGGADGTNNTTYVQSQLSTGSLSDLSAFPPARRLLSEYFVAHRS
jgi:hypothetical protein